MNRPEQSSPPVNTDTLADPRLLSSLNQLGSTMLPIRIRGQCMSPRLQDGELAYFARQKFYWPGDIVVFTRSNGQLVAHRLLGYYRRNGKWKAFTKGDNNRAPDGEVAITKLIGKITSQQAGLVDRFMSISQFSRYVLLHLAHGIRKAISPRS
ncbi:MAG: S24/S26 family peptidase [bacterium]